MTSVGIQFRPKLTRGWSSRKPSFQLRERRLEGCSPYSLPCTRGTLALLLLHQPNSTASPTRSTRSTPPSRTESEVIVHHTRRSETTRVRLGVGAKELGAERRGALSWVAMSTRYSPKLGRRPKLHSRLSIVLRHTVERDPLQLGEVRHRRCAIVRPCRPGRRCSQR
jgi:hypothetical protein